MHYGQLRIIFRAYIFILPTLCILYTTSKYICREIHVFVSPLSWEFNNIAYAIHMSMFRVNELKYASRLKQLMQILKRQIISGSFFSYISEF